MLICEALDLRQGSFALTADLSFPVGAITALIGPSGAGKSTFLAAIAGFFAPASGRILWDQTDLTQMHPGMRPVSILFQDNNLFPHLTAAQNVGLGLRPDLRLSVEDKRAVKAALAAVGLQDFGDRKPGALSGGQQSRVALARVLVADRSVVLLDEPFAALGPALKAEMLDLVRDKLIAAGKTVVIVTHDPSDARRIADKVAVVAEGSVTAPVPTDVLLDNPPPALAAYLG
ncbi:MAG: ATP-binding cassette domain-containing protein [Yoonia sp.]|uniref:thiamine ABC transporter ATP-binding protein n=1 Tax=Yoonia sp. TaxID=2212373 RepID=UPI00273F93FB|nr:ATP-binding cassette domain-containing protein [Yoonia sp.]MDP5086639.1 ATP-binding cassette domain-containing protein [Yoonia sp.]MDP5359816.1 ATP-binding cassette domain-containing protein [Paracoccaceae bacterium]MDP5362820.1 ATP-binding cassette domain-containing protein [Paracoccaceae bacterium]